MRSMRLGQDVRDALSPKPVDVDKMTGKQLANALMMAQLVQTSPRIASDEYKRTRSHVKPNAAARRAARIVAGKMIVKDGQLHGA